MLGLLRGLFGLRLGKEEKPPQPQARYVTRPLVDVTSAARSEVQPEPRPAEPLRPQLSTSAVTVISHAHGRQRREERDIDKRELQEAVKYGRKERANPGRDGKLRWRYIHKGVVYITDKTGRHEITSWRMADALEAPPPAGPLGQGLAAAHVVVIVDHSGSMRKGDVPGYDSRTAAVYDCLAKDLVEPQLKNGGGEGMQVSLIEMADKATVVCKRTAADQALLSYLKTRMHERARSHGNYLPALDAALELMKEDAGCGNQLFLVFLSDGVPSDHTEMACKHGVQVWQPDPNGGIHRNGRPALTNCPWSNACRLEVHKGVHKACLDKVKHMGDLLGRDRVFVGTVAFGPPDEDYRVLEDMAKALPKNSFQKLGLSASNLRKAFTSLTSSLTSLRTDAGGGVPLTLRTDIAQKAARHNYEEITELTNTDDWLLYVGADCRKQRYDADAWVDAWVDVPYKDTPFVRAVQERFGNSSVQLGIAHAMFKFGEGAERVVFQCSEVVSLDGGKTAYCVGPRLVAKQPRHEQNMKKDDFHRTFCRTQGEAEDMARLFNRRLAGGPEMQVRFLPCHVYTIVDPRYAALTSSHNGKLKILVEEELEGCFTKWNNNGGGVNKSGRGMTLEGGAGGMGGTAKDKEKEEYRYGEQSQTMGPAGGRSGDADVNDVPQAFSHFSYMATDGKKLVCDLQGVWNRVDGFTLTDPVIHHVAGNKRNGATDKGREGMENFFATHTCNALCRRLGLQGYTTSSMRSPSYGRGAY